MIAGRPSPEPFDILIRGCTVVSGVGGAPILRDGAIGIRADRLAHIGPDDRALNGRRVIAASGQLALPGFVNVHTHAILSHSRGMTVDLSFAPAYMPGVPHVCDVREDEAVALARLGALEAMMFGSTLMNDMYVHAGATLPAMAELGLRVSAAVWIHDVDFTRVHDRVFAYGARLPAHSADRGRLGPLIPSRTAARDRSRRLWFTVRLTAAGLRSSAAE